jgi:hypothetical protein
MHEFRNIDIRKARDTLLEKSDWTQLPDTQVEDPVAWLRYRQALRDFPDTIYQEELATGQCVENPIWPEKPKESNE